MQDDWLDGDDLDAGAERAREWDTMQRNFGALGFRDGVAVGEESTLQKGFNEGFREGAARGIAEGEVLGIAT